MTLVGDHSTNPFPSAQLSILIQHIIKKILFIWESEKEKERERTSEYEQGEEQRGRTMGRWKEFKQIPSWAQSLMLAWFQDPDVTWAKNQESNA